VVAVVASSDVGFHVHVGSLRDSSKILSLGRGIGHYDLSCEWPPVEEGHSNSERNRRMAEMPGPLGRAKFKEDWGARSQNFSVVFVDGHGERRWMAARIGEQCFA
jgi:hypothetical protein